MTDRGEEAEVVQEAGTRSYQVQTQDGKFRRNQRALIDLPNTDTTDLIDSNETPDIVTNETNMAEASVSKNNRYVAAAGRNILSIDWIRAGTFDSYGT